MGLIVLFGLFLLGTAAGFYVGGRMAMHQPAKCKRGATHRAMS